MPWQKGIGGKIYANTGRKGYEYEKDQLERMKRLLNRYLTLSETVMDSTEKGIKVRKTQKEAHERLQAFILKISDKLHANKNSIDLTGSIQIEEIKKNTERVKSIIAKYKDDGQTESNLS